MKNKYLQKIYLRHNGVPAEKVMCDPYEVSEGNFYLQVCAK